MATTETYTQEQAEEDIAELRGEVSMLDEILITGDVQTATLEASGAVTVGTTVTATGGTQGAPTLIHTDTWQSLGSSGLAGASGTARYRLTIENELQISIHLSFTTLGATTTATFANSVTAALIPPSNNTVGGDPFSCNPGTPVAGSRLAVNSSTGVVTLINIPSGANVVGVDVKIPLD